MDNNYYLKNLNTNEMKTLDRTSAVKRTANAIYDHGYDSLSDSEISALTFDQEFNKLVMERVEYLKKLDMNPSEKGEEQLDKERKEFTELENSVQSGSSYYSQFFNKLQARAYLRMRAEEIAEGYLSLLEGKMNSQSTELKLLEILDTLRSRDISTQDLRFNTICLHARRELPKKIDISQLQNTKFAYKDQLTIRKAKEASYSYWEPNKLCPPGIKIESSSASLLSLEPLDFSCVVLVHMGFIKEDLVIACDANTETFLYGRAFAQNNRKICPRAFSDFGYQVNELSSEKLIGKAYRIEGVKTKIKSVLDKIYERFETEDGYPSHEFFMENIIKISELINTDKLLKCLKDWAEYNNLNTRDICLVIEPDETLFIVPFAFLLDQSGQPLIKHLGGLSISLSLATLKTSLYYYHWRCEPFLSPSNPSCTFFGSVGSPPLDPLDIESESSAISKGFGEANTFIFSDSNQSTLDASCQSFYCWHSSADIIWFAGHGSFDPFCAFEYNNEKYRFPITGIHLSDGSITNLDILNLDGWNFSTSWLLVFNSCLLGRTLVVNSNPLGFLSSLCINGAISTVSSLWPIPDEAAVKFAERFSASLLSNYNREAFPKASALRNTLVNLWDEFSKSGNPFIISGYFLCGIP